MKISVALCTYNGEKYIRRQLESIGNQTYVPDKIIIFDDLSTDKTVSVIEEFISCSAIDIELHVNTINKGFIKNFEAAINSCSDGIVFLCDQDDIWHENKVECIVEYFTSHPAKHAVFHDLTLFSNDAPINKTMWQSLGFDRAILYLNNDIDLLKHMILFDNVVTGAALAIRKNGDVDFRTDMDYVVHDFQIALKEASKDSLGVINQCLGFYRIHDKQNIGAGSPDSKRIEVNAFYSGNSKIKTRVFYNAMVRLKNLEPFLCNSNDLKEYISLNLRKSLLQYISGLSIIRKKMYLLVSFVLNRRNVSLKDVITL